MDVTLFHDDGDDLVADFRRTRTYDGDEEDEGSVASYDHQEEEGEEVDGYFYTYNNGTNGGESRCSSSDDSDYESDGYDVICHSGTEETIEITTEYCCDNDDYDIEHYYNMDINPRVEGITQKEKEDELLRQVNKTNVSILVYKYVIERLLASQNWGNNKWNDTPTSTTTPKPIVTTNTQPVIECNKQENTTTTNTTNNTTTTNTDDNISLLEEQVAIAIEAKALAYRQAVHIATRWKPRFADRFRQENCSSRRSIGVV